MNSETVSLAMGSKPRYEILDGLRGVAAMIVVAFHLFETYSPGPDYQILNHGYLAVDFFFVLSGFVLGYAYDDRWGRMTLANFFKRRIIRLQPMLVMGTLIGAGFFYFGDAPQFSLVADTPVWKLAIIFLLACVMFPTPPSMDIRGWQEMNSLNGASWSLSWEYIANILYATVIRRLSRRALGIFVGLSALLTIDVAMNIDTFGLLEVRSYAKYTVIGGFGLSPDQLYIGLCRLLYPFFAGLLVFRMNKLIAVRGGFGKCSAILAAVLVFPHVGGQTYPWVNGVYNAAVILFVFPLIVSMGAGSAITGARWIKACKFLGEISYPLYITHYPLIYVQMDWVARHPDSSTGAHIWVAVSLFLFAIAIAYSALRLYDLPVRDWLKRHWLKG